MSLNHVGFGIIRAHMKLPDPSNVTTSYHQDSQLGRHLKPVRKFQIGVAIFLVAFGVRLLNWQARGNEPLVVQSSVAENYKQLARLIRTNGVSSLYYAASSTTNPELVGPPTRYPIVRPLPYSLGVESDRVTQLLQILFDSFSVVLIL